MNSAVPRSWTFAMVSARLARCASGVGLGFGAAEREAFDACGHGPPDFEQRIAADGAAGEERLLQLQVIEQPACVDAQFFDGDGALTQLRLPVTAQIGDDESIVAGENFGDRHPEAVIDRRGVEQDDGGPAAEGGVEQLRAVGVVVHGKVYWILIALSDSGPPNCIDIVCIFGRI